MEIDIRKYEEEFKEREEDFKQFLVGQMKFKDWQIGKKDEQMDRMHEIIDKQQQQNHLLFEKVIELKQEIRLLKTKQKRFRRKYKKK